MIKSLLSLLVSILIILQVRAHAIPADTLTAATILHRSENAYAGIKTYLDSGKLIENFEVKNMPIKNAKYFKTAYAKTGGFNFEYYEPGRSNSLYTINRTDSVVKTWWGVMNRTQTEPNLNRALGTAVGVSGSTSSIIPNLLLTADFKTNNIYHTIPKPELLGTEMVGPVLCYKIKGIARGERSTILWIAKMDLLIRKLERESVINPATTGEKVYKLDSIVLSKHARDTAYLKKDSIRKAKMARTQAAVKIILADNFPSMKPFTVKSIYLFYPYTLKKPNADLFKFKPNREIAL